MLEFFRKYQRSFFLIITFFVVISFSFFGTFNVVTSMPRNTTTAFRAVDGTEVSKADVEEMVAFLTTDIEDKQLQGGAWGANFLNDGVIKKDLLETGIAAVLAEKFASTLGSDLQSRLEREKKFEGYKNPKAPFMSSAAIWDYFAPEINTQLTALQMQDNALSPEALRARVALYLAEKRFPESMLRQVLMYQQKQYSWLPADETLLRSDLSIFGYHSLIDWFGPHFTRLVAEFIINSAMQAKQMGYSVSREEALADLLRNASISYQQNSDNPNLGVSNQTEYYKQQLQKMNMDQSLVTHLWQQILLFRRMYQNGGGLALVDRFAFENFGKFAGESVSGELYALPKALQINNLRKLHHLEMYLKSVTKKGNDPLALPTTFLAIDQVIQTHPELVQKNYLVEIATVDKRSLEGRVTVQQMWDWEVSTAGWNKLKVEFPELGVKKSDTADDRHTTLDSLDHSTRTKVDSFSRKQVVDTHPDWLTDALEKATPVKQSIAISYRGGATPFAGLKDNATLIQYLDNAPLSTEGNFSEAADTIAAGASLKRFSADDQTFYRINVLEKPKGPEILTFEDAENRGLLEPLSEAALKGYYATVRDKSPDLYKNHDGSWKPFEEVRTEISNDYLAALLKSINDDAIAAGLMPKGSAALTGDRAASLRLYKYVRTLRDQAVKDPDALKKLAKGSKLTDQWNLEDKPFQESRSSTDPTVNLVEAFALPLKSWSKVEVPNSGALAFFEVTTKGPGKDETVVREKVMEAHALLSNEAQQKLAESMIEEMIQKKAISLNFMDISQEGTAMMSVTDDD